MKKKSLVITVFCLAFLLAASSMAAGFFGLFGEDEEQETIEVWSIFVPGEAQRDAVEDVIDRFEEDHPEANVEHVAIQNDDYKTRLSVAMAAGDYPDVFLHWGGGDFVEYVNEDILYDMTEEVEQDGWSDEFLDAALELGTVNDSIYGVPVTNVAPALVWYREDMFAEHGVTPPDTYEELLEIVDTFRANDTTPFVLGNQNAWPGSMYYMYLVDRIGGPEAFQEAVGSERTRSFTGEPFVEAGEKIQELVDKEAFPAGFNGTGNNQAVTRMYNEEAVMYLMGSWAMPMIGEDDQESRENLDFFMFPEIENGEGPGHNLIGTPGENFFSVTQEAENKELAIELLRYFTDEQAQQAYLDLGFVPPFEGIEDKLDDPLQQEVYNAAQEADYMQLWYDQYLPSELAEIHLNSLQAVFGGDMTPEEKAEQMAEEISNYYDED